MLKIFIKTFIATILPIALPLVVTASSGGDHHKEQEEFWRYLPYQAANVLILFGILIYFGKKPIIEFFTSKKTQFLTAAEQATKIRRQAEEAHQDIKVKLTKLDSTSDESIERAKAEAADLVKSLITEANEISARIKKEAQLAAALEVERAKVQLKEQLIRDSLELARTQLEAKVSSEDHKRLQGDFITNIQAVQQ